MYEGHILSKFPHKPPPNQNLIIGYYVLQKTFSQKASNQNFISGGLYYVKLAYSQINSPPQGHCHQKLQVRVQAQLKKSALTLLFGLSNAFQNGMTQPCSTHDHGGDRLQGKMTGCRPSPIRWTLELPTHKLATTSLKWSINSKVDLPKQGHTDRGTNTQKHCGHIFAHFKLE